LSALANLSSTNASRASQEIDLSKIRHKSVLKYIRNKKLQKVSDLARLIHSCPDMNDVKTFNRHIKTFLFEENIDKVWMAYKTIGPGETCSGWMLGFGLQYSRRNDKVTYHEDDHGVAEEGQIVIMNLKLLWSTIGLAVGHEITEVNDEEKYIQMCYLEGGASRGMQYIRLKETPEGYTQVIHETFYKSDSAFRDKRVYPPVHGLVVSEFHRNVRRKLKSIQ
jgi:hypothetical protein